ncbi:hypothetical protein T11_17585 [Trichinella zimbabwensis]|uniref:Uncharacterized protein n=1 Tax=Trichinella zimbabwensis TaxID=268475 RepID=A0A0V1GU22_9BILA|nr:hypothetical protein T11_7657 [Trichinella zimbabwensis]KRZ01507.1 hypothetical protein T11_17585 [Trichinella zimbabwensis]
MWSVLHAGTSTYISDNTWSVSCPRSLRLKDEHQHASIYRTLRELEEMLLATKISTHPDLLGEGQFANTSFRCLPGS